MNASRLVGLTVITFALSVTVFLVVDASLTYITVLNELRRLAVMSEGELTTFVSSTALLYASLMMDAMALLLIMAGRDRPLIPPLISSLILKVVASFHLNGVYVGLWHGPIQTAVRQIVIATLLSTFLTLVAVVDAVYLAIGAGSTVKAGRSVPAG